MRSRKRSLCGLAACGVGVLLSLLHTGAARAQGEVVKKTLELRLGDGVARVGVYERRGSPVTFFSPHHNERVALEAAKESVARHGGRLVAVESFDEQGRPARRLGFTSRGKTYSIDPNRIFTAQGRRCAGVPAEAEAPVADFAGRLLEILFDGGGRRLREGERVVVAVHNNGDVDDKNPAERAGDLTSVAYARAGHGPFHEQAAGVYLSNLEQDTDNFVLLSTPALLGHFVERGYSVVVQKPPAMLRGGGCGLDDGSLSVYASLHDIPYVNLEADARTGGPRQRQMIEAVRQLLPNLASN